MWLDSFFSYFLISLAVLSGQQLELMGRKKLLIHRPKNFLMQLPFAYIELDRWTSWRMHSHCNPSWNRYFSVDHPEQKNFQSLSSKISTSTTTTLLTSCLQGSSGINWLNGFKLANISSPLTLKRVFREKKIAAAHLIILCCPFLNNSCLSRGHYSPTDGLHSDFPHWKCTSEWIPKTIHLSRIIRTFFHHP